MAKSQKNERSSAQRQLFASPRKAVRKVFVPREIIGTVTPMSRKKEICEPCGRQKYIGEECKTCGL